jgi:hypothetical protein
MLLIYNLLACIFLHIKKLIDYYCGMYIKYVMVQLLLTEYSHITGFILLQHFKT